MKQTIENAIEALTKKARSSASADALRYSQAVCNLANALSAFNCDKRAEEIHMSKSRLRDIVETNKHPDERSGHTIDVNPY